MKLSIVFVSSVICLSTVAAKKHGLRRALRNQRKLEDSDYDISCEDIFDHLDTNGDGTLTYEEAVDSLTQWGATDDEIANMLEGFGPGDSVPKAGFIQGCESAGDEKKGKVQKIKLAYAQSKAKNKQSFGKKAESNHILDGTDDDITCAEVAAYIDINSDGSLSYEEGEAFAVEIGFTADEFAVAAAEEGYGPGDSVSTLDWIGLCESDFVETKMDKKKALFSAAEKVQKIKRAHAGEKKEKKTLWKKAESNHILDGTDDDITCAEVAAYIDINSDGSLSYEEGEAFAVEIGFTADEYAAAMAEEDFGPGDSVSTLDWIGLCESDFVETKMNKKKALFGAAEKVQKIERAHAGEKKEKKTLWKKAESNHILDGTDDDITCAEVAAYIDINSDGSLSYEEGEAFAVEIGFTADEYAAAMAEEEFGPGDSVSTLDWIGLCESDFVETKMNKKKALFGAAEKVQKIERAHAGEKKEKKTLWKKAATNHILDGTDDDITCAEVAAYIDINSDGSLSYEEGEAFAVEIGFTADEYAAAMAEEEFGPGDSVSTLDWIGLCESDFVETKMNKKKALFGAAEKVQKIKQAQAGEKKEKKTLWKKAESNHILDGTDDDITCAEVAAYIDRNDDGSISYEEGEAFAAEVFGTTADEYAAGAAEEGFGPGDSMSVADATAICESAE